MEPRLLEESQGQDGNPLSKYEHLTEVEVRELEAALLKEVPPPSESIGNGRLRDHLGWDDDKYWFVRNRLIDQGILELGRGRGGTVRRVIRPEQPESSTEVYMHTRLEESRLYQPIAEVLQSKWIPDKRYDLSAVEITAKQGKRETGGKWTRPDIVVASMKTYVYVPERQFDITTFEVKTADAMDVSAVYECVAHLRSATQAYLLLYVPESEDRTYDDIIELIGEEAKRHGVGLYTIGDPHDYDTWDQRVDAYRHEPVPEKLNSFITIQLSERLKDEIAKWLR